MWKFVPFDQTKCENNVDDGASCVVFTDREAFAENITLVVIVVDDVSHGESSGEDGPNDEPEDDSHAFEDEEGDPIVDLWLAVDADEVVDQQTDGVEALRGNISA